MVIALNPDDKENLRFFQLFPNFNKENVLSEFREILDDHESWPFLSLSDKLNIYAVLIKDPSTIIMIPKLKLDFVECKYEEICYLPINLASIIFFNEPSIFLDGRFYHRPQYSNVFAKPPIYGDIKENQCMFPVLLYNFSCEFWIPFNPSEAKSIIKFLYIRACANRNMTDFVILGSKYDPNFKELALGDYLMSFAVDHKNEKLKEFLEEYRMKNME